MAEKTIDQLPDNPGLTGSALFEVQQGGASYKATVDEWNALLTADVDAAVEDAEAAQAAASASQTAAAASASAAASSATAAAASATSASTSATAAGTSATNAASSATAAASSASAASTSATNAASSATAAASSASSASATLAAALRGDITQSHNAATRRQMRDNAGMVNWHNVVDYGADSTGATNSATAIAAAIAAAGVGGVVYFPRGTYRSDAPIAPLARQRLVGDGPRQSFLTTQNASGSASIVQLTSVDDVLIHHLGFLGNAAKAASVADYGITAADSERLTIENCYCDGQVQRFCYVGTGSHGALIRECYLEGTRYSNVIEFNGSLRCTVENTQIYGQKVIGSETGIEYYSQMSMSPFLSPVLGMRVVNVRIYNVGGNGINYHGCEDSEIIGCHIEGTQNKGIFITKDEYSAQWARGNGVRVLGNMLVNCSTKTAGDGGAAIALDGITGCVVKDNSVIVSDLSLSRYPAGIEISGFGNLIEGNLVYIRAGLWRGSRVGYLRYGILLVSGSGGHTIRNNRIVNLSFGTHAAGGATAGNGADGIALQGDGNILEGNEIIDERPPATTRYVADATARLALSGLRIGQRVIQQSDFLTYEVIPHAQTSSGLLTSSAAAWGLVQSPPHFAVSSQAAMLALENATVGDICVRSDLTSPNRVKYLSALPASTLGNWVNLVPGDATGMLATGLCSPCLRYGVIIQTGCKGNIVRNTLVKGACAAEPVYYPNFDVPATTKWGPITRTVTLDVGSVAAGATATQAVTFDSANVRTGAQVHIGVPHNFPTGLTVRGYIASSGVTYTVTLVFQNTTGGALDPASGDYTITVTEV